MGKGLLIAVSGFSGAGKGTIMKMLMDEEPDRYALSVSATTRQPREGEKEGVHYYFKTKEEFEDLIRNDRLIEYAQYVGNYYGTPKDFVLEQLELGKDVFLEIEVQGVMQVMKQFPDLVSVFVVPPSIRELLNRLKTRATETEEVIRQRVERAVEEAEYAHDYQYILVNNTLEESVTDLKKIIAAEHQKTENQKDILHKLQDELGGIK